MLERIKTWFYEWNHGHPFLLHEEVDIVCEARFDEKYKWMTDDQIKRLIETRVREMYKEKYPNAKRWSLNFKKQNNV